jgi:putative ABC transport system permease protein
MKLLPLIWAMLWRRRMRTALTFASIVVAFLLFGLLEALLGVFTMGLHLAGTNNLQTFHRFGFIKPLPYGYRSQLEALPGVASVTPIVIFPIVYKDPGNSTLPSLAVDPATIFGDDRFVAAPEVVKAFQRTRTGMVATRALADKYGWKVGDRIPLISPWVQRKDGADHWEFELVGLFDFNEKIFGKGFRAMRAFLRYDFVDEARVNPGQVNFFFVRVTDAARMPAVARAVDALFQNSANPTRTQTDMETLRQQLSLIGDIGLIITSILSAVFFTLMVVAGNTMMRAFRDRIPDLSILKTLGFGDRLLAAMMAAESVLLCVGAGLAGLLLAWLLMQPLARAVAEVLPFLRMEPSTFATGTLIALALALLASAIPAWHSARLNVIEGLAHL